MYTVTSVLGPPAAGPIEICAAGFKFNLESFTKSPKARRARE